MGIVSLNRLGSSLGQWAHLFLPLGVVATTTIGFTGEQQGETITSD